MVRGARDDARTRTLYGNASNNCTSGALDSGYDAVEIKGPTGTFLRSFESETADSEMSEGKGSPEATIDLGHSPVRKDANAFFEGRSVDGRDLRHVDD